MAHSTRIAEILLEKEAVRLKPSDPFTWASGLRSPIYCDNRVLLSYPKARDEVKYALLTICKQLSGYEIVAGVATAGIPMGAILADHLGLPFIYIRSSAKGHGRQNRIEGVLNETQKVLVVEDLVSTGKSCLDAVNAIRVAGGEVNDVLATFTYQLPEAEVNFREANCNLHTLTNYENLIQIASDRKMVNREELASLTIWRKDTRAWSDEFENKL